MNHPRRALRPFRALRLASAFGLAAALGAGLGMIPETRPRLGQAAPAAGAVQWRFPITVNDDLAGARQSTPALVADPGGALHAAWVDERLDGAGDAVYYARLPAGAGRWEANRRVRGGDDTARRADPALTVDSFGGVHLVWTETRDGDPDIYHSLLEVGSQLWSASVRVNDDRGHAVQWSPAIAPDLYGSVHVVWADQRSGGSDIYHARRLPDGSWSASTRVNNPIEGDQRTPALTATKSGDLFAVWEDTRMGKSDIFASRLPPGGDVWWPNGMLDRAGGRGLQRSPAIGSDSSGQVHALWVDEGAGGGGGLRAATLIDPNRFWEPDRAIYQPTLGSMLSVAVAGGPGGRVLAVWGETRPDENRLYSGIIAPETPFTPARVDASPVVGRSEAPKAAIDAGSRAHVLWHGDDRAGQFDILHAQADLGAPAYPPATASGWLQYRARQVNCGTDGFVTIPCDGAPGRLVVAPGVDLVPFLGSYVTLSGYLVEDSACSTMVATGVNFKASPCPRQTGAVTGVLTDRGQPVEGAQVQLGDMSVATGPSGRYFFDGLTPGARYTLTATLPCALPAQVGPLRVAGGINIVPAGAFTRGEVIDDCTIDLFDLVAAAAQYHASPPYFPSCSDVDGDGMVGIADLAIIGANYDATCPALWQGGSLSGLPSGVGGQDPARSEPSLAPHTQSLDVTGATDLYGWSIELAYDRALLAPRDTDPAMPGVQPFDLSRLPAGAHAVENRVDDRSGHIRLAVTLVGRIAPRRAGEVIGGLSLSPAGRLPGPRLPGPVLDAVESGQIDPARANEAPLRIIRLELVDREGRPLEGRLRLSGREIPVGIR